MTQRDDTDRMPINPRTYGDAVVIARSVRSLLVDLSYVSEEETEEVLRLWSAADEAVVALLHRLEAEADR